MGWRFLYPRASQSPQKYKEQFMDIDLHKLLLKKAGALLARRAYSRADLQTKLAEFADEEQVESALEHLERLNLLNDPDYAYNFALRHIRQQRWSSARVQNALLAHHVDGAMIERALEKVRMESGGEETGIREYVHKRYGKSGLPTDPKGVRKLILHLLHRGFDEATIIGALRGVIPYAVLKHFETGESID
jgi:SOS response regulatory protein OraA/RecX